MNDHDRVTTLRSFLEGLREQHDQATGRREPFVIDGVSTIDFLTALLNGYDDFTPDFESFKARMEIMRAAPRHTVCVAMTGWKTLTPAPKPSTP